MTLFGWKFACILSQNAIKINNSLAENQTASVAVCDAGITCVPCMHSGACKKIAQLPHQCCLIVKLQ